MSANVLRSLNVGRVWSSLKDWVAVEEDVEVEDEVGTKTDRTGLSSGGAASIVTRDYASRDGASQQPDRTDEVPRGNILSVVPNPE